MDETYDAFIARPVAERRRLYQGLSAQERSDLWLEQLLRFRADNAELTAEQRGVLDEAEALIRDASTFEPGSPPTPGLERVGEAAIAAFGKDTALLLLASLGPPDGDACSIA
ncbi:bacteriocin fulvocin C-related protein [Nonomuraea sp. NPDC049419]|uniref:bacteriocin fulvocin C-related protein n=1 Tax=Nonomuraea sp. NPDC049419 TaxID=3155772 RepID=UPI00343D3C80